MLLINLIKLTLIHPHLQLTLRYNTTDATAISMCDTKQRQSRLHIPSVLHMHVQTLFDLRIICIICDIYLYGHCMVGQYIHLDH